VKFTLPFHVGSKPEPPDFGPRPFSGEWLALPPEERALAKPGRLFVLPHWVPSEQVVSGLLVILLIFGSMALAGPGISRSDAKGPQETAITAAALTPEPTGTAVVNPPVSQTNAPTPLPTPTSTPEGAAPTLMAGLNITPDVTQPAQGVPGALLPKYRILAYYGHPNADTMGILGEYSKDDLFQKLTEQKAAYEAADPSRPVKMAFELIASVGQPDPQNNGSYLLHTDAKTIQEYADFARDHDMILILDMQIGHSTVKDEIAKVSQFLKLPYVHLGLDPEFATSGDVAPGDAIGTIDAADVTDAQNELAAIAAENKIPPKLLVVHRFTENMVTNSDQIEPVNGVQLVIDFDGFGEPDSKTGLYEHIIGLGGAQFAGFKLFYKKDDPLLTPAQVIALKPAPDFVVYQ
jgi:hypothetical protein